jgi:ubiquinone/menaquinone biosynthesis C-methylase UbiE
MPTQEWDPATYARNARFVSDLGAGVFELLAPQPGERVLDVGCGFGATTAAVAQAVGPSGRVVGIDISAPMIERARARLAQSANGTAPVELVVGDAQSDDLRGPHDAVVSRFGMMFFADTPAAIAHISGAVRPGAEPMASANHIELGNPSGATTSTATPTACAHHAISYPNPHAS